MYAALHHHLQRHRVRIGRFVWIGLALYLFGYERAPVMPLESPVGLAGVALILLGLAVRSLSAGALHKNTILATDGIYAIVRNPLYFGSLLLLVGANVIMAQPLMMAASAVLFAITYVPTILREEKGLAQQHPDLWASYIATTPRLVPGIGRLGELKNVQWSARQWYKNHEHNTIIAAVVILALFELYSRNV